MLLFKKEIVDRFLDNMAEKITVLGGKIYLHGSFNEKRFQPDSDIDLVIIIDTQYHSKVKREINDMLVSEGILINPIILTPEKYNEVKDYYFFKKVIKEGKTFGKESIER